jgi:hypothetical protein
MSEPVVPLEDTLPEPDDVVLTEEVPLPDVIEDVPDLPSDTVEAEDIPGLDGVEELPDIPGGDFVNRRGGLVEG